MVVYSNPNGSFPHPHDLGLKDFYHDKDGNYVGTPDFIPLEYKGHEEDFYKELRLKQGREACGVPQYNPEQEYQIEMTEEAWDNCSYGRNRRAERIHAMREHEVWLRDWN